MAASAEGLTLDEMARESGVGRRTAERMRDAVLALYPAAEEVSDPPTKRWRIRGGLSAFEQAPTTTELVELSKAAQGLRSGDIFRAFRKPVFRFQAHYGRVPPDPAALDAAEKMAVAGSSASPAQIPANQLRREMVMPSSPVGCARAFAAAICGLRLGQS